MLEHIFFSVISTSLSVSVVIILLTVLTPLIDGRYAAKWKYMVWILLALRLVFPIDPAGAQDFFRNPDAETAAEEVHSANKPMIPAAPQPAQFSRRIILEMPSEMNEPLTQSDQRVRITPLMVLISIWLTGSVIFVCTHLYSYLHYRRLLRYAGKKIKDHRTQKLLRELSDELKLPKVIPLIEYTKADSPMVTGFLQPVLVLPAESYSDEELYFILKHELVHYMHHDVYWKLLFVLANAVHWFNPAVWIMHREAVVDMELSCDERVVSGADRKSKKAYTETLYATLHRKCTQRYPLSTQLYGGKRIMQKRFRNILGHSVKRNGVSILLCTIVLMIGTGVLIGCSVSEKDRPSQSIKPDRSTRTEVYSAAASSNIDTAGHGADGVEEPDMEKALPDQRDSEAESAPESLETALPENITLTYIMEGEPEEQTASLYAGDGYAIYVPDDDWEQYSPDMWRFVHNDKICFWVTCYEQHDLETSKNEIGDTYALLPVTESGRENEMEGQIGDMITRARLIDQKDLNRVWAVFYSYPEEAIEGAGARLLVITDTFCLTDGFIMQP